MKDRSRYSWINNSKPLHAFLNKVFQMPLGVKKGRLRVPTLISHASSLELPKWFIVGLMDSDGSVAGSRNPNAEPRVELRLSNPLLLADVKEILSRLGVCFGGPYPHPHDGSALIATTNLRQIRRYAAKLGFSCEDKAKRLENLLKR